MTFSLNYKNLKPMAKKGVPNIDVFRGGKAGHIFYNTKKGGYFECRNFRVSLKKFSLLNLSYAIWFGFWWVWKNWMVEEKSSREK